MKTYKNFQQLTDKQKQAAISAGYLPLYAEDPKTADQFLFNPRNNRESDAGMKVVRNIAAIVTALK